MGMSTPFEVTIHGALRQEFEKWCEEHHMEMVSFGDDEAGMETFVLVIKRGSPLALAFERQSHQDALDGLKQDEKGR